jgi:hypothetical protein
MARFRRERTDRMLVAGKRQLAAVLSKYTRQLQRPPSTSLTPTAATKSAAARR